MAEERNDQQERTEQPTAKRLRDARRRGQIARSRELTMTIVMVAGATLLYLAGERIVGAFADLMSRSLNIPVEAIRDSTSAPTALLDAVVQSLFAIAPMLILLAAAAIFGGVAMGGWAFSTRNLEPNFSKLNPFSGVKRVFGVQGLVEMLKAIAKAGVVAACALGVFYTLAPRILALGAAAPSPSMASAGRIIATTFLVCSASLALIALADVPFQLWSYNKKLRMTRKEVYDELKDTEGKPEVKSRIRSMQQELANRRMLEKVPGADVVITNPTHFAVALKYEDSRMRAPVVVAKGIDHMAQRIREIATENRVPLFESPVLARSLYATSGLNDEIDPRLYVAVAQVLTYIYQLRNAERSRALWPDKPAIDVDEELSAAAGRRGSTNSGHGEAGS